MSFENYSCQKPGSFVDRLALRKRLHMLALFKTAFPDHTIKHILDVGVTADLAAQSSNYMENYYPNTHKIIALSNQDISHLASHYPGLTIKQGDACALPFDDQSIDVVFSAAVIEHVGKQTTQQLMLAECLRVAKQGVFITTPNRWHPIEVHTLLPLLHWLPKSLHRKILFYLRHDFYAQEQNLNLLDQRTLGHFCRTLGVDSFKIHTLRTFGWISNLILIIKKNY